MAKLAANSIEGKSSAYLKRIETLLAEGETAKATYMNECKSRREDVKAIYTEAKDNGIPVKALRGLVKYRELERKQDAIADGLDIDEASTYETLIEALGPLGEAAAKAAGHTKSEAGVSAH